MNTKIASSLSLLFVSTLSVNAHATLASNAVLQFTNGVGVCVNNVGTYPDCSYGTRVPTGSYFGFDIAGNGTINSNERAAISLNEGIKLGVTQSATGAHNGAPDGSESPSIDMPFEFFGATGMHQTTSPVTILSDDGMGHVTLDFSGWSMVIYDDTTVMDLGGHNPYFPSSHIATLTCNNDCSAGDSYVLDYLTRTTNTGFNNILYGLHLEGTISSVPVPAAFWLFGSGLLGLLGITKRRKA